MDENPQTTEPDASVTEAELRTPEECAQLTGNTYPLRAAARLHLATSETVGYSAIHHAAAQLHGWNAHRQATSKPFMLTISYYRAALKAVATMTQHPGALSEFAAKVK